MYLAAARQRVVSPFRRILRTIAEFDRRNLNIPEVESVKQRLERLEPSGQRDEYISKVDSLLQSFERANRSRFNYETLRHQLSRGYHKLINDARASGTDYSALTQVLRLIQYFDRRNFNKSQLESVKQRLEQLEPSGTGDEFISEIERLIRMFDHANTLKIDYQSLRKQLKHTYNDLIDQTLEFLRLPAPAA